MIKFFAGLALGAGLAYAFLVYPAQSKQAIKKTVDTASTTIGSAVNAGQKAADNKLSR